MSVVISPSSSNIYELIPTITLGSRSRGTSYVVDHLYYDCVVHLGLGVYDNHTTIMIEDGAMNQRRGKVCWHSIMTSSLSQPRTTLIPTKVLIPTTTPSKDAAGSEPPSPRIDETKDDSFVMEDRGVSDIIRRSVAALALEPRIGSFQAVRVGARDANKYICKLYPTPTVIH